MPNFDCLARSLESCFMPFHWPNFHNDDPGFIAAAAELVQGFAAEKAIARLQVIRIDNWFGPEWLLGASGMANIADVVVPPFAPLQLTAQSLLVREASGAYSHHGQGPEIHHDPASQEFIRLARNVAPGTDLFWISGNSLINKRGSTMAYHPGPAGYTLFFVEFQYARGDWRVSQQRGMPPQVVAQFRSSAGRFREIE